MGSEGLGIGLTFVKVTVGNPGNGHRHADVNCLIDSGAVYSLIPGSVLRKLQIKPHSTREFVLANGDVIRRRIATATCEYEGRRGDSMVIVGEIGDDPLLGATTLEGFGLVLDPFRRELRPMTLPLKGAEWLGTAQRQRGSSLPPGARRSVNAN
jgi:clan AA aspartic protease